MGARHLSWHERRYLEYVDFSNYLFENRYTAARNRARRILGDGYNAFIDALPDDATNLQICEALEKLEDNNVPTR